MSRRRLILLLSLALLVLAGTPRPVAAHAYLERAEPPPDAVLPTAPARLQLWFSETIEPTFSEVVLLDTAGQPVPTGRPRVSADNLSVTLELPALADGAYTVTWKALSTVDGHTTRGFYTLTIGAAATPTTPPVAPVVTPATTGPPVPIQAVVRWLTFLGQAVLVGGLLFGPAVLAPALARAGIGPTSPAARQVRRRRILLERGALLTLALAALAALVLQTIIATDLPLGAALAAVPQVLTGTRYGLVWIGRVLLLLALAGLPRLTERQPVVPPWATGLNLVLGLGLLLTTSLTSHGAAVREGVVLAVAADWLHLIALSAWLGGLVQLVLVLPGLRPAVPPDQWTRLLGPLVSRFSALALAAVGVIVVTGVYSTVLHVDTPEALLTTDYGRALLAKLLLLLPMLVLGALNLLIVRPELTRALRAAGGRASGLARVGQRAGRLLGQATRGEVVLGLLILAAAGVLTSVAPARQPTVSAGLTRGENVADLRLTLRVVPAVPGENTMELTVTRDGRPVETVSRALIRLTFLDQDLGESEVVLAPAGGGRYTAQSRQLSVVGQWQAEVIVRRDGQEDAQTAFRFSIPVTAAPPATAPTVAPPSLTPLGLVALGLVGMAGAALLMGVRLRRAPTMSGVLVGGGVGGLVLAGFLLVSSGFSQPPAQAAGPRNPFPPTAASLAQGRTLYTAQCQSCHGLSGKGDGPMAASLNPPPLDLTQHVGFHSDAELYRFVSQGVRGTSMAPFAGRLTEEEIWHVINYIRTYDATRPAGQTGP